MTTPRLQSLKTIATWGGVAITFSGIVLSVASGGSVDGACLALFGLLLTCFGHWISSALAKRQAVEKAADQNRIAALEADNLERKRREDRGPRFGPFNS